MEFLHWTSSFSGDIIKPYQTEGAVKMNYNTSYVLGMLNVQRYIRKQYLAETLNV